MHMTKDRYLATAVLLMVAILFVESGNIPEKTSWQAYESSLYPQILLGCIASFAFLLLFHSCRKATAEDRETSAKHPERNLKVLGIFVLFGGYAALLPVLGYLVSTMAFMVTTQALLLGVDTRRKWVVNLATASILVPLVYVIFKYGLNVWLP
ncbi:tripartite tricarboxylate transporter TctB family protein [Halomonas sediminis]